MENKPSEDIESDKIVLKEIYLHQHTEDNAIFEIFQIYEEDEEKETKEEKEEIEEKEESVEKIHDQKQPKPKPNFTTNCTKRHELNSALLTIKKIDGFDLLGFLSNLNAGIENGFDMTKFLNKLNADIENDNKTKAVSCLNKEFKQNKGSKTTSLQKNGQQERCTSVEQNTNHNLISSSPNPMSTSENYLIVTDAFGSISIENNSTIPLTTSHAIQSISPIVDNPQRKSSDTRIDGLECVENLEMDVEQVKSGTRSAFISRLQDIFQKPQSPVPILISNVFGKDDIAKDSLLQSFITVDCNINKSKLSNNTNDRIATEKTHGKYNGRAFARKKCTHIIQSNSNDSEMTDVSKHHHSTLLATVEDEHPLLSRLCEAIDSEVSDMEDGDSGSEQIPTAVVAPPSQQLCTLQIVNTDAVNVSTEAVTGTRDKFTNLSPNITVPVISAVSSATDSPRSIEINKINRPPNITVPVISAVNSVTLMPPKRVQPSHVLPAVTIAPISPTTTCSSQQMVQKPRSHLTLAEKYDDHSYFRDFNKRPIDERLRKLRESPKCNPIIFENCSQIDILDPVECNDINSDNDYVAAQHKLNADHPDNRNTSMPNGTIDESVICLPAKRRRVSLGALPKIQSVTSGIIPYAELNGNAQSMANAPQRPNSLKTYSKKATDNLSTCKITSTNQTNATAQPALDRTINEPVMIIKDIKKLPNCDYQNGSRKFSFRLEKKTEGSPCRIILYKCKICHYLCSTEIEYKMHLEKHKPKTNTNTNRIDNSKDAKITGTTKPKLINTYIFKCHDCKKDFPNRQQMLIHCKEANHKQLILCKANIVDLNSLAPAIKITKVTQANRIRPSTNATVAIANQNSNSISKPNDKAPSQPLQQPILPNNKLPTIESIKKYECSICSMKYTSMSRFKIHMLSQHAPSAHICKECYQAFTTEEQLENHLEEHLADSIMEAVVRKRIELSYPSNDGTATTYLCTDCGVALQSKRAHAQHVRTHLYKCNICSQIFSTEISYKNHVRRVHDVFVDIET